MRITVPKGFVAVIMPKQLAEEAKTLMGNIRKRAFGPLSRCVNETPKSEADHRHIIEKRIADEILLCLLDSEIGQ